MNADLTIDDDLDYDPSVEGDSELCRLCRRNIDHDAADHAAAVEETQRQSSRRYEGLDLLY